MKRLHFVPVISAAVALAGLSACTPSKEDKPPTPKVTAESPGAEKAVAGVVASLPKLGAAPQWQMTDLNGKVVTSEELKGKVVVVDFWATWCGPCRMEIPGYIELQKRYGKDGLVIVGASIDQEGPSVVKSFAAKEGINYTMVMADEAVVNAFGGIAAVPTTFLIDRNGQIRDRKEGAEHTAVYEKRIAAVLAEKA